MRNWEKTAETRKNTATFEMTGIKLVDDFIKKFCKNFTHPVWFGVTPIGTADLQKQVKATVHTSELIFDVKKFSFKMKIADINWDEERNPFLLGSVRNEKSDCYIEVFRQMGVYKVAIFEGKMLKNFIKDLKPMN